MANAQIQSSELVKFQKQMKAKLTDLYNLVFSLPSWREAVISLLPKEGKEDDCGSYQPINVLDQDVYPHFSKNNGSYYPPNKI